MTKNIGGFRNEIKRSIQLKDEVLDYISTSFNIAQFASYSPNDLTPRFSRIHGYEPNYHFPKITETLQKLIEKSQDKSINIRTFKPDILKGNPFYYGIKDAAKAHDILIEESQKGYYTIVNETIDINDGGVSGVVMNNIIEFSPNDTPKCVEKDGVCLLPKNVGLNLLNKVYGFYPDLELEKDLRVEFSVHPKRRGYRKGHTIIWEVEEGIDYNAKIEINWPNNFSRFLGDKVFGLLIAEEIGGLVPKSIAITRNVAPFSFGKDTGLSEIWFRTSPIEKTPGKYPTFFGWADPFKELRDEESLSNIASILSQHSVNAMYSGAAVPTVNGVLIEGVLGFGDDFMLGQQSPITIPREVYVKIESAYKILSSVLGKINIEWVFDGEQVWIVQLSKSTAFSNSRVIYPGEVKSYIKFPVERGLETLRKIIKELQSHQGIELIGRIGITSHLGDILRNAQIPSKLSAK